MSDVTGGSSVLSSSTLGVNVAFNLHDEKSTIQLLRAIHQSILSADDKNELRDLVFSFRNTQDAQVTSELTDKFSSHGFTLAMPHVRVDQPVIEEVPVVSDTKKSVNKLGTTRPSPTFGPVKKNKAPVAKVVQSATPSKVVKEMIEPDVPVVSATETLSKAVSSEFDVSTETEKHSESSSVSSSTSDLPMSKQTVEEKLPVSQAVPAEKVQTAKTVDSAVPVASSDNGERIKEIKREVNLLVGNPVNLIDVNNKVGREYMSALLDAMKKNNAGTPEQVERAMDRLESSFVSVKQTVAASSEVPIVDVQEEVEVAAPSKSDIVDTQDDSESSVASFVSVHDTHVKEKTDPVLEVPETPTENLEEKVAPEVSDPTVSMSKRDSVAQPVPPSGIMSVAKEKQIEDLLVSQKQEAAVTDKQREGSKIEAMDPLMAPEITSGLQQLLSEWVLFKSSGIFGTGPSGSEHPLYKKLSVLTMSAVMAGRFEGATPEIKRSISDYMNGWRYEEGILHEHSEMFDHYLRRVVKHIIDKRKSASASAGA